MELRGLATHVVGSDTVAQPLPFDINHEIECYEGISTDYGFLDIRDDKDKGKPPSVPQIMVQEILAIGRYLAAFGRLQRETGGREVAFVRRRKDNADLSTSINKKIQLEISVLNVEQATRRLASYSCRHYWLVLTVLTISYSITEMLVVITDSIPWAWTAGAPLGSVERLVHLELRTLVRLAMEILIFDKRAFNSSEIALLVGVEGLATL